MAQVEGKPSQAAVVTGRLVDRAREALPAWLQSKVKDEDVVTLSPGERAAATVRSPSPSEPTRSGSRAQATERLWLRACGGQFVRRGQGHFGWPLSCSLRETLELRCSLWVRSVPFLCDVRGVAGRRGSQGRQVQNEPRIPTRGVG